MQYIMKCIVIVSMIIQMSQQNVTGSKEIILLLLMISMTLLVGEFKGKWRYLGLGIELMIVSYAMVQGLLMGAIALIAFDLMYNKKIYLYVPLVIVGFVFCESPIPLFYENSLSIGLAIFGGYVLKRFEERNLFYRNILDSERRARYELETIKNQLVMSSKEIERLTEVKERNRIARDLHDSLGHSIAGILFQLQAGIKLMKKDAMKSEMILNNCVDNLQASLSNIRNTVHNMYSNEKIGLDQIKQILHQYCFCEIHSKIEGDFSRIPIQYMEGITWVIKEALTNTSKHSDANQIHLELICNQKNLRLFIQDNGKGSVRLVEGLGIKSMRDRMHALGGILSVDGKEGLRIVCTIPLESV